MELPLRPLGKVSPSWGALCPTTHTEALSGFRALRGCGAGPAASACLSLRFRTTCGPGALRVLYGFGTRRSEGDRGDTQPRPGAGLGLGPRARPRAGGAGPTDSRPPRPAVGA